MLPPELFMDKSAPTLVEPKLTAPRLWRFKFALVLMVPRLKGEPLVSDTVEPFKLVMS